jgi:hypothetical protein
MKIVCRSPGRVKTELLFGDASTILLSPEEAARIWAVSGGMGVRVFIIFARSIGTVALADIPLLFFWLTLYVRSDAVG